MTFTWAEVRAPLIENKAEHFALALGGNFSVSWTYGHFTNLLLIPIPLKEA